MTHAKKELKRLLALAKKQGVEVTVGGGGHLKWLCPKGIVHTAKTPGDYRSIQNIKSMLKKAGLEGV